MQRGQMQLEYLLMFSISVMLCIIVLFLLVSTAEAGKSQLFVNLGLEEPAEYTPFEFPQELLLSILYLGTLVASLGITIFSLRRLFAGRVRKDFKGEAELARKIFKEEKKQEKGNQFLKK